jgi:hypothetical protein
LVHDLLVTREMRKSESRNARKKAKMLVSNVCIGSPMCNSSC